MFVRYIDLDYQSEFLPLLKQGTSIGTVALDKRITGKCAYSIKSTCSHDSGVLKYQFNQINKVKINHQSFMQSMEARKVFW